MSNDEIKKVKYHSTNQFRNVVKTVKDRAQFMGVNDEGKAIIDSTQLSPTLDYTGTVKLHGTNANIVIQKSGSLSFHSKNNMLGYYDQDDMFVLINDNAEFAQSMSRRSDALDELITKVVLMKGSLEDHHYPIKISGEWAGNGIQKGVGISQLEKKGFFVFGIKFGEEGWVKVDTLPNLTDLHDKGIYAITDFPTFSISIDFNNPEYSQNKLVEYTEQVENCCPVSEQLGMVNTKGKPSLLGEGIVWTPCDSGAVKDTGTWFKTKGQKHSVSKVKSVAAISPEKLDSIKEFVEYACTTNRLEQGIVETGELSDKAIGKFIGWVNKDINKEEGDVLEANNLTMKEVGKYCATESRKFYITKLNADM